MENLKKQKRLIKTGPGRIYCPGQELRAGEYIWLSFPEFGIAYMVIWRGVPMPYTTIDGAREYLLPSEIVQVRQMTEGGGET